MTTTITGRAMAGERPVIPQVSSTSGDSLPAAAVGRAMRLAASVHDDGPDEVAAVLRPLGRQDLLELAVTLAAMVPVDYSPAELLAWNDCRYQRPERARVAQPPLFPVIATGSRPLKPHGSHAAFIRHKDHGEKPCAACKHGEREYQRERGRRRRAEARRSARRDEVAS